MTQAPYDHNLTDVLQTSAEYIALKPTWDERASWITFLLQELETFYKKEEFTSFLADLQEQIANRIARGNWD